MVSTRINRYIKVRGAANPYEPLDVEYFSEAPLFCMAHSLKGPHGPNEPDITSFGHRDSLAQLGLGFRVIPDA